METLFDIRIQSECGDLIVGDEPCTYSEVCASLIDCKSAECLWRTLKDLARGLKNPSDQVFTISQSLQRETCRSALHDILETWRAKESNNAKLKSLLLVLTNLKLRDCADALLKKFQICKTENLCSLHVNYYIKERETPNSDNLQSQMISFQGHDMELRDILDGLEEQAVKKLEAEYVVSLRSRQKEIVIKKTFPKLLENHISRRISFRFNLSREVFGRPCTDVYVIQGIEPHELSDLAKNEPTGLSIKQKDLLTVRFIVGMHDSHYEDICKISNGKSVHLINHNSGRFEWVRTHGKILNLQDYVHKEQNTIREEEFPALCLKSLTPVLFSDTPGMGKTVLLVRLANSINALHPDRLVIFVVLKDFISKLNFKLKSIKIKKLCEDELKERIKVLKESIIDLIAEHVSCCKFGKELVKEMLLSENKSVEIQFDGFDEVLLGQLNSTIEALEIIVQMKSVRMYITTRPHLRDYLENTFETFSFSILGFEETEQVKFLTDFWAENTEIKSSSHIMKRLDEFARKCLTKLKENMKDEERDIAGMPLQCKLLAEVYKKSARDYSDAKSNHIYMCDEINIPTIYEMYRKLMFMRFSKLDREDQFGLPKGFSFFDRKKKIFEMFHMLEALNLLFPSHTELFREVHISPINEYDIYDVGILEKSETEEYDIRFVHRTFAEYFIGLFFVKVLICDPSITISRDYRNSFVSFFLNKILGTTKNQENLFRHPLGECNPITSCKFRFPAICYFINAHLEKYLPHKGTLKINVPEYLKFNPNNYSRVFDILDASARGDYPKICNHICNTFLLKEAYLGSYQLQYTDAPSRLLNLQFIASKYAGRELIRVLDRYRSYNDAHLFSRPPNFMISALHIAVERGNYSIAEYLLNKSILLDRLQYLVHCCVFGSVTDSLAVVDWKKQIIKLLKQKASENDWLNEALPDGTTPLLHATMSTDLFTCLVECDADLNRKSKNGLTPFLERLASVNLITFKSIKLMENKGYRISKELASKGLKILLCNQKVPISDNLKMVKTADYLMEKGGELLCRYGRTPWELEATLKNMDALKTSTHYNSELKEKLEGRGLSLISTTSESLYEEAKSVQHSFENIFVSLISCQQIKAAAIMRQCLRTDIQTPATFLTLQKNVQNHIQSKHTTLLVLQTVSVKLSIIRLKDLIDPDFEVLNADDINLDYKSQLLVCRCSTATKRIIDKLTALKQKIICLCEKVEECVELGDSYQLAVEKYYWKDLSGEFHRRLEPIKLIYLELQEISENDFSKELNPLAELIPQHSSSYVLSYLEQNMKQYLNEKPYCAAILPPGFKWTLLHVAVARGHLTITKYLLECKDFLSQQGTFQYLIHCCVAGSICDSEAEISQKIKIIDLFSSRNNKWLNEPLPSGSTPVLTPHVHTKLLKNLVEHGANVNVINKSNCLLHKVVKHYISPENYHEFLQLLLQHGFKNINCLDSIGRSPFHAAIEKIDLLDATITLFITEGANFNSTDKSGNSILFSAVSNNRSDNIIRMLSCTNDVISNTCAYFGSLQGIIHFLNYFEFDENNNNDINTDNNNRNHRALTCNNRLYDMFIQALSKGKGLSLDAVKLFETKGLCINNHIASEGLKSLICNHHIMPWELGVDFVQVADYMVKKGADLASENGGSPWKLEISLTHIIKLLNDTKINPKFLAELDKRGVIHLTERQFSSDYRNLLMIKLSKTGGKNLLENLCISLVACGQIGSYLFLKQCLLKTIQYRSNVTPATQLIDFLLDKQDGLCILKNSKKNLTLTRINETIGSDFVVLNSLDDDIPATRLVVFQCNEATKTLGKQLALLQIKTLCLCTNARDVDNYTLLDDETCWLDI